MHDRLRVVAVDVKDRRLNHLGHVGRVRRKARLLGRGSEADLVVDDDVDRAARAIGRQLREAQRLGNDSLPREGRVAMQQDWHDAAALAVAAPLLLGPHDPFDHRVDQLQVAGVRAERAVDLVPARRDAIVRVAEVILDVAVPFGCLRRCRFREFAEDDLVGLVHRVRENVQPAAVRHAHHDFFRAEGSALFDQRVEQRNQRFGAFDRESLFAEEPGVQEFFERLGRDQQFENAPRFVRRKCRAIENRLHPLLEPRPLLLVRDVHELDAERSAIRRLQLCEQIAKRLGRRTQKAAGAERAAQVFFREAELVQLQERMGRAVVTQRIEPGDAMPQLAVGMHQIKRALRQPVERLRSFCGSWRQRGTGSARFIAGKERPPLRAQRLWIALVLRLQALQVFGVRAVKEIER